LRESRIRRRRETWKRELNAAFLSLLRFRGFRGGGGAKGLQREIAGAEAADVFQLAVKFVLVSLFVANQALEELLRYGVGVGTAVLSRRVVIAGAALFHFAGFGEHFSGISNWLNRSGSCHLDIAFQEENAFGEGLHVAHFHDGGALEKGRQGREAKI